MDETLVSVGYDVVKITEETPELWEVVDAGPSGNPTKILPIRFETRNKDTETHPSLLSPTHPSLSRVYPLLSMHSYSIYTHL